MSVVQRKLKTWEKHVPKIGPSVCPRPRTPVIAPEDRLFTLSCCDEWYCSKAKSVISGSAAINIKGRKNPNRTFPMIISVSESAKLNTTEGPVNKKATQVNSEAEISTTLFSILFGRQLATKHPTVYITQAMAKNSPI